MDKKYVQEYFIQQRYTDCIELCRAYLNEIDRKKDNKDSANKYFY